MHNQDQTYQNLPDMHKLWQTCQEYLLGQAGHGYCSVRSLHSYSFVVGCSRRKSYPEPPHVPNTTGVIAYMLVPSRACLHFFTRQGLYTSLMMQTKTPQLYPCPYSTEVSSRHSSDAAPWPGPAAPAAAAGPPFTQGAAPARRRRAAVPSAVHLRMSQQSILGNLDLRGLTAQACSSCIASSFSLTGLLLGRDDRPLCWCPLQVVLRRLHACSRSPDAPLQVGGALGMTETQRWLLLARCAHQASPLG